MTLSNLDTLADQMCVRCSITRTNIKSIGAAWEENPAEEEPGEEEPDDEDGNEEDEDAA